MGCQVAVGRGGLGKKGKGLRRTNWQLQNSPEDVNYSIGNIVKNNCNNYVWWQVSTRLTGGESLPKLDKRLTTILYT